MPLSEFLRVPDVAPLLGVTEGRVYQMIAAGDIPATRISNAIRIPRRAWEEWLADQNDRALAAAGGKR